MRQHACTAAAFFAAAMSILPSFTSCGSTEVKQIFRSGREAVRFGLCRSESRTQAEPWFKSVRIAPQPGGLKWIDAATPHPKGMIRTKLRFDGDAVKGEIVLPSGVNGVFEWKGRKITLKPGDQDVSFE